jgi:hypothetical protein
MSRVADPDSIGLVDTNPDSESGFGIRIRIQEGKNDPQKYKFFSKFMFLSVGWPLLRADGFFCNLDVLYEGLGKGKL